jgi:glutathione synthase/RimK-type ligase-like ATP-grasp enzyme
MQGGRDDGLSMRKVALVTAQEARTLDEDMPPLLRALEAIGIPAEPAVWDDPKVDWGGYALAVVRSTWDYVPRVREFLRWAERVASVTPLANPLPILRWSTDKRYLRDLSKGGAPVVPTHWIEPFETVTLPFDGDFVVKPAVSAGAKDTNRYSPAERDAAAAHVRRIQASDRMVMVQPYLKEVDRHGETGMVFLEGEYSHAIRKGAILRPDVEFVKGLYAKEDLSGRTPSEAERAVAERVLPLVPGGRKQLLYARVDVAPGPEGTPVLLELELAEPSLFFAFSQGAEHRMARAIAQRLT